MPITSRMSTNQEIIMRIFEYWLKRGYRVKLWVEHEQHTQYGTVKRVMSDMVNGYPKDYKSV